MVMLFGAANASMFVMSVLLKEHWFVMSLQCLTNKELRVNWLTFCPHCFYCLEIESYNSHPGGHGSTNGSAVRCKGSEGTPEFLLLLLTKN